MTPNEDPSVNYMKNPPDFCADCGAQIKNTDEACPRCGLWLECHDNTIIHDPKEAERKREAYRSRKAM